MNQALKDNLSVRAMVPGGGLRGLPERWPVPFAVSVLLALASFGFGVAWVVVWYVRLVKAAFDAQAGLH